LNAARTAFSLPFLSNLAPSSSTTSRARDPGSSADACFGGAGVRRPRRLASAFTAIRRASISASSSRANDPAKSLGSKCRPCESALSGSDLDGWTGRSGGFPGHRGRKQIWRQIWRRSGHARNYWLPNHGDSRYCRRMPVPRDSASIGRVLQVRATFLPPMAESDAHGVSFLTQRSSRALHGS